MAKKNDLTALTRGNGVDEGWSANEAGRWTPSVWDRRRLGTETAKMMAEQNGLPFVPPQMVVAGMTVHSTSREDMQALLDNFNNWNKRSH